VNWWNDNKNTEHFQMALNVLFGSCLAFGLEVSEYFAVYKTSSITLSVVGIIKVSAVLNLLLCVHFYTSVLTVVKQTTFFDVFERTKELFGYKFLYYIIHK